MKKRQLSAEIFTDLKTGCLKPMLEAVQNDDTLDMEFRGSGFNVYYRGGSLFSVKAAANNSYTISFDEKYDINKSGIACGSPTIEEAVKNIPAYKQTMDGWFNKNPKLEREIQQHIVRENNSSNVANSTDYFMADIEYAYNDDIRARFDLVAVKWLSKGSDRKNNKKPELSLIELKFGDKALKNNAGIKNHLDDFAAFIKDKNNIDAICEDMSVVFSQKCKLGLITCLKDTQFDICISPDNVEVVFIFANHDPDSTTLASELAEIDSSSYDFPIKVAVSSMMGYGIFRTISLDEFKATLKSE